MVRKQGSVNERIDLCEHDGEMFELTGLSDNFKRTNTLMSGATLFFISKATINDDKIIMRQNTMPEILGNSQIHTDYSPFVGNKTILAIKVDATDTETTSSASKISDKLFGTSGDKVNIKSQISGCSMNQLNFIPFNGTTPSGEVILNGVGNVDLPFDLKNKMNESYENKIFRAVKKKYGNLKGHVDHLLLVLPKNAANYVAYAVLNGWVSAYNDDIVLYPTMVMHEISHNMGFEHSSEGNKEYGDGTGVLGVGKLKDDDKKCFNAVKSWDLGWYVDGHKIVDPSQDSFDGQIVGMANFDQRQEKNVIIKIVGHNDRNDYYVAFNRRDGINKGTTKHGDKVIVTSKKSSNKVNMYSYKEAALSSGEFYTIKNFGGNNSTLVIKVNSISINSSPAYADISISLQDPDFINDEQTDKELSKRKKSKKNGKKKKKRNKRKANKNK